VPELRQFYDQGSHYNRNLERGDDMSAKWSLPVLIGLIVVLVIWGILQRERKAVTAIGVPTGWTFTLPEGDAKAGRSTFKELRCLLNVHTVVPDPCYDVQNEPAAVQPERHFLTVKELMNLVAFLKQVPEDSAR
jgi:hypothetical protein